MRALYLGDTNLPRVVDIEICVSAVADLFGVRAIRVHELQWRSSDHTQLFAAYPGAGRVPTQPAPLEQIRPVLIFGSRNGYSGVNLTSDDIFVVCREVVAQEAGV